MDYSRFTDRSRKVMQLAIQEAQRMNHEYVGSEHILLGLLKEGSGVASNVLKNLDIDMRKLRLEVEKHTPMGANEVVAIGKLPLTPIAKKALEYAAEEADALTHKYVGTEHLLLGVMRGENVACKCLEGMGLKIEDVRAEVLALLGREPKTTEGKVKYNGIEVGSIWVDGILVAVRYPRDIPPADMERLQKEAIEAARTGGAIAIPNQFHYEYGPEAAAKMLLTLPDEELARLGLQRVPPEPVWESVPDIDANGATRFRHTAKIIRNVIDAQTDTPPLSPGFQRVGYSVTPIVGEKAGLFVSIVDEQVAEGDQQADSDNPHIVG